MWLTYLYIDDSILVIDKPSGLLSVPGIGADKQDCLASRAAERFPGARIVHRLDMDTSGVIVLARDADTHRELSRQFHDREVEKTYLAIAHGHIKKRGGTIDLPIRKDLDNPPLQIVDFEQGRPARTHWRVLERKKEATRVELTPHTGRSHQLRLHLLALGHPILGDDLYGLPTEEPDDPVTTDQPGLAEKSQRLLLHACSIVITHPGTGRRERYSAPCPF